MIPHIGAHGYHHLEFFGYMLLVLILLYFPPAIVARNLGSIHNFLEGHYGDTVGFTILLMGIGLILIGDVWPQLTHAFEVGNSLLLTAMGVLKLTKSNANGNGNAPSTTQPTK